MTGLDNLSLPIIVVRCANSIGKRPLPGQSVPGHRPERGQADAAED